MTKTIQNNEMIALGNSIAFSPYMTDEQLEYFNSTVIGEMEKCHAEQRRRYAARGQYWIGLFGNSMYCGYRVNSMAGMVPTELFVEVIPQNGADAYWRKIDPAGPTGRAILALGDLEFPKYFTDADCLDPVGSFLK